eukprot:2147637-Lingulodinium_polyedra.AAC.1
MVAVNSTIPPQTGLPGPWVCHSARNCPRVWIDSKPPRIESLRTQTRNDSPNFCCSACAATGGIR